MPRNALTSADRLAFAGFVMGLGKDTHDQIGKHVRLFVLASVYDAHAKGEDATVSSISRAVGLSRPAVMDQLRHLEADQFVRRTGRTYLPRMSAVPLLREFTDRQLRAIAKLGV